MSESADAYFAAVTAAFEEFGEPQSLMREVGSQRFWFEAVLHVLGRRILEIGPLVSLGPGDPEWVKYRFHLRDSDDACIWRYDNSPHHTDLPTFPAHMHVGAAEELQPSNEVNIPLIVRALRETLGPI